ncbi:GDP-L-fucose synthase [candidate division KSB1 bacterium]|nr:GDP-L-fucose synthase [candidate division KSB1 bacterium]
MKKDARIFVAGSETLFGKVLVETLRMRGYTQVEGVSAEEPDLTDLLAVERFFSTFTPEYVFLTGGKSGGIHANQTWPADLMLNNLMVQTHVMDAAFRFGASKLLYLASSCSYPRQCPQPMDVTSLLTGPLEPTNEAYAVAKLAGIKLAQAYNRQYGANFICGIPANGFGRYDDFITDDAHVIPSLLRKMREAKMKNAPYVVLWGSGQAKREFIDADDVANACLFLMANYNDPLPINIGGGDTISIRELAWMAKEIVGYQGDIQFDARYPDGMPIKQLDASPIRKLGWKPEAKFKDALKTTYEWYMKQLHE